MDRRIKSHWWIGTCAALLLIYATLAWISVSQKSATYDEPLSVVSAWSAAELRDYRIDYEHPPLWKRWAWIANWGADVEANLESPEWQSIGQRPMDKWAFADDIMYKRGNGSRGLLMRSRAMMLAVALLGGILVAAWARQLAGPIAAVAATALYAFDPGLLAHGPLVKNDVPNALLTCAILYVTWQLGRRPTVGRVLSLGLLCGVALVVKLSAVILGPIVAALLLGQAIWGRHWGDNRAKRVATATGICVTSLLLAIGVVWAAYGFRYGVSTDPAYRIDMDRLVGMQAAREWTAKGMTRAPTEAEMAAWQPGTVTRATLWLNDHRLLPEPWLAGLLFTQRTAAGEVGYLNGENFRGGRWYYFLEAIAVKSPVATVLSMLLALGWAGWRLRTRQPQDSVPMRGWDIACLVVPVAVILAGASLTGLPLGVRYVLAVYPPLFVLAGMVAASAWHSRAGKVIVLGLGLVAFGETLRGYPNYLAFFNVAAGGAHGGFHLLGDSNLDWGQDLPLLKAWRDEHPDGELWLSYFGTEDPAARGIRYRNMPGGYTFGPEKAWPTGDGWVAISATNLQGIYLRDDVYAPFRNMQPEAVLGGTLYVFRMPHQ